MKPKLRFKEFSDEWEEKKLGDIAEKFTGGGTPSTKEKSYWINGDIPWIQSSDLSKECITLPVISKKITSMALEKSAAKKIMADSIAIVIRVGVGKVAYIDHNYATSQDFLSLSSINGNSLFWAYRIKKLMEEQSVYLQGTSIKGITKDEVLKIITYAPSLPEQEKIGQFLSLVDKRIEKQEQRIELLKKRKKGWMQKIFNQEIRFKDENGNDYPDWEEKKLGDIATCTIGLVTTMTENYVENGEGVPLIRNSDIYENRIESLDNLINLDSTFAQQNRHRFLHIGDIITVHTGDVGTSAIISEAYDGSLSFAGLQTRIDSAVVCSIYLSWYFNSIYARHFFLKMSTGDGRNNLNLKDFKRLIVPLPSLPEQEKIAGFLSKQDELIEQEEKKLELLKEQKKGLLQQMFV